MKLKTYLKQFNNIAWYPSACKDALSMVCLSFESLLQLGIPKNEMPDCFIFTDYDSQTRYSNDRKFFLDLDEFDNSVKFGYPNSNYQAIAYNVKELDKINISFDQALVTGERDDEYYGRVFVMDVVIEHPQVERFVTKLIYVVAENTAFAFDFLLKNQIKVTYAIHSRYGHGFGGGWSTGAYMFHILKDLGVRYFVSDMDEQYNADVADKYLSEQQKALVPILREISNFADRYNWYGYNPTILYKVEGYTDKVLGFFERARYRLAEY